MSGEEKKEEVEEIGGEKEVEDLIPDEPGPIRRGATFPTRSTPYDRLDHKNDKLDRLTQRALENITKTMQTKNNVDFYFPQLYMPQPPLPPLNSLDNIFWTSSFDMIPPTHNIQLLSSALGLLAPATPKPSPIIDSLFYSFPEKDELGEKIENETFCDELEKKQGEANEEESDKEEVIVKFQEMNLEKKEGGR